MESISIKSGSSRAEVLTKGAYVKSLSLEGCEVLKPTPDGIMTHGGCAILLPYAERVRNGTYSYDGRKYSLPKNSEGNAIHGFLKDATLEVKKRAEASIELGTQLAHSGYPTTLDVIVKYGISSSGFSASCEVLNAGERRAPLSIGFHPYFVGSDWKIGHACKIEKLEMSDRFFPNGARREFSFNGKEFGTSDSFDDCFYFPCDAEIKTRSIRLTISKKNMPYSVVYNGKWAEGESVAFEPYTSAPDAFNNGYGLINLPTGQSYECGFDVQFAPE